MGLYPCRSNSVHPEQKNSAVRIKTAALKKMILLLNIFRTY